MWNNKLNQKIEELRNDVFTKINEKVERKFEKYAECFTCRVLANKNKMKPLAVFERQVFDATSGREFVLNGYVMRMEMNALSPEEKTRDDKTTTIYFCQHCKVELPKITKFKYLNKLKKFYG